MSFLHVSSEVLFSINTFRMCTDYQLYNYVSQKFILGSLNIKKQKKKKNNNNIAKASLI